MSKITLTPHASGTGTLNIAAPNTNSTRTLTLPDADLNLGNVLTTSSSVDAANLTGALPAISGAALTDLPGPDYEAGSWTPTINLLGTQTLLLYDNWYVKVGKLVTLSCNLRVSTTDTTQDSTHLSIGNIPFVVEDNSAAYAGMAVVENEGFIHGGQYYKMLMAYPVVGTSTLKFNYQNANVNYTAFQTVDRNVYYGVNAYLSFTLSYQTAA